ncbi:hypothetical protein N7470_003135 [Penicillium chermesinum]|nr:hypothetical protein N7470_003135 [Penicillium chermesinum]
MVSSSIDANPLDPNSSHQGCRTTEQSRNLHDLDMIIDRNIAPCAELAQQHALEDLHNMTEHVTVRDRDESESMTEPNWLSMLYLSNSQDIGRGSFRNSVDRGTQVEPRHPEE